MRITMYLTIIFFIASQVLQASPQEHKKIARAFMKLCNSEVHTSTFTKRCLKLSDLLMSHEFFLDNISMLDAALEANDDPKIQTRFDIALEKTYDWIQIPNRQRLSFKIKENVLVYEGDSNKPKTLHRRFHRRGFVLTSVKKGYLGVRDIRFSLREPITFWVKPTDIILTHKKQKVVGEGVQIIEEFIRRASRHQTENTNQYCGDIIGRLLLEGLGAEFSIVKPIYDQYLTTFTSSKHRKEVKKEYDEIKRKRAAYQKKTSQAGEFIPHLRMKLNFIKGELKKTNSQCEQLEKSYKEKEQDIHEWQKRVEQIEKREFFLQISINDLNREKAQLSDDLEKLSALNNYTKYRVKIYEAKNAIKVTEQKTRRIRQESLEVQNEKRLLQSRINSAKLNNVEIRDCLRKSIAFQTSIEELNSAVQSIVEREKPKTNSDPPVEGFQFITDEISRSFYICRNYDKTYLDSCSYSETIAEGVHHRVVGKLVRIRAYYTHDFSKEYCVRRALSSTEKIAKKSWYEEREYNCGNLRTFVSGIHNENTTPVFNLGKPIIHADFQRLENMPENKQVVIEGVIKKFQYISKETTRKHMPYYDGIYIELENWGIIDE